MIHLGTDSHARLGLTPRERPEGDSWKGKGRPWSANVRKEPGKGAWPLSRSAGRRDSDVRSSKDAQARTRPHRWDGLGARERILVPPHRADWSRRAFELSPSANWNHQGISVRPVQVRMRLPRRATERNKSKRRSSGK